MVRAHVIDVEIEILNVIEIDGYCEHCMTLKFMYHRAMITVDRPIDSYLYESFSD